MILKPALQLIDVTRLYGTGDAQLRVFDKLSLEVHSGEVVALLGQSGSGKSSLLHIAGLLEKPSDGRVLIAGQDCTEMDDGARTRVRRIGVGFVYQFHHLLPEFNALENVVMPQLIAGATKTEAEARGRELLDRLRLSHRLTHRPAEMSGGEQQRVAICRALANRPLLLLADEPTGNLDPETAAIVHEQFMTLIRDEGLAAVIATHNEDLASKMTRVTRLQSGKLTEDA